MELPYPSLLVPSGQAVEGTNFLEISRRVQYPWSNAWRGQGNAGKLGGHRGGADHSVIRNGLSGQVFKHLAPLRNAKPIVVEATLIQATFPCLNS